MFYTMSYTPESIQCLTQWGFPEASLRLGASNIQHPIYPELVVSPARHLTDFRLYYAGPPTEGIKIPTRLISTCNIRWRQSVARWYQQAVFAIADIRRAREEAETRAKQKHENLLTRITDLIPAGVNVTAEEVHNLIPLRFDEEGKLDTNQYYNAINLDLKDGMIESELVSILARLKAFLKENNIPHR